MSTSPTATRRLASYGLAAATALAGVAVAAPAADAARTGHTGQARHTATDRARPGGHYTTKTATSRGSGGAVTSVDPEASRIGIRVLRHGGNAVDAAIATAAALGVTEPYSSGLGGGGYFVYYDARTHKVHTIDGRETAPAAMPHDAFIDPSTGKPYPFTPQLVTSGVSVGVPGSPATWARALRKWGRHDLRRVLRPAERLARRGFVVDATFRRQTEENKQRFEAYTTTPRLYLPGGDAPAVGSVLKNPDLAKTYKMLGRKGMRAFYTGPLARQIAHLAQHPPKSPDTDLPVPAGYLKAADLKAYHTIARKPTHVRYRGLDVYGMAPSSSGGTTVGEALNIMKRYPLSSMSTRKALHLYLEASALAYADRKAYLGDPAFVDVPQHALLSDKFAAERACGISETKAFTPPVAAGDVHSYDGKCSSGSPSGGTPGSSTENRETTNMTVSDKWGNVVEYTLTIEQTGGSGMLVPGRGFLLNNELTDFTAAYDPADPNRIEAGKRPRSSISPTIVLRRDRPYLALGSPGGATIITTVLQTLFDYVDRGMSLPRAIAAPRASQENAASVVAEQSFIDRYGKALGAYGHTFTPAGDPGTSAAEIGAATAIRFHRHGRLVAASEPTRRGGGSALVVHPRR